MVLCLVVPLYSSASSPMVNGLIGHSTHKQRRKLTRFCHMSDINRGQAEGGGGGGGGEEGQTKTYLFVPSND